MRARVSSLCGRHGWSGVRVTFTAACDVTMLSSHVRAAAAGATNCFGSTAILSVTPPLATNAQRGAGVCTSRHDLALPAVEQERPINEGLGFSAGLSVPDIEVNHCSCSCTRVASHL